MIAMPDAQRRLLLVWVTLMCLTIALAIAADVTRASRLGPPWLGAIAAVTILKARFVLGDYLGLRGNRGAMTAFTAALVLTLTVIVVAVIVA